MIGINNIQTFVFVHDQDIVEYYENIKKFNNIPNFKYVFLGNGSIEKIYGIDNLIIARDLPYNLENYPKMCAYSGWYVLYKNNLIDHEYVNLLEYDVNLNVNFIPNILNIINSDQSIDFYGYVPFSINNCFLVNENLKGKLNEYYPDLERKINNKCFKRYITEWSSTSNSTMKKDFFYRYMTESENIFLWMKDFQSVGHELERNLSIFQILNEDVEVKYIKGMLNHFQLDSHKTQGIFNQNYKEIIKIFNSGK